MEIIKLLESKMVDLILTLSINSLSKDEKIKKGNELAKQCLKLIKEGDGNPFPDTESKCNKHIVIKCTTCAFDKIGLLNKNCIGCGDDFANYKSK